MAQRRHSDPPEQRAPWRRRLHRVIFGVDTRAGRAFDIALLWSIVLSVTVVMLDSVEAIHARYTGLLYGLEWGFTVLFTVEYAARLLTAPRPARYALSVYGLIDLLAVLPTYLSLFVAGAQSLLVIRTLRLLRVFRVFKLTQYLFETDVLLEALRGSRRKVVVFVLFVLSVTVIMGALMYLIEGPRNGFTSIPRGMYWAIVTVTTVGYGDIAPRTVLGQVCAGALMVLGYGVIAVPTGIVSVELAEATRTATRTATQAATRPGAEPELPDVAARLRACPACAGRGHDADARHCKHCGAELEAL